MIPKLLANDLICAIDFESTGTQRGWKPVEFACALMTLDGQIVRYFESEITVERQASSAAKRFTQDNAAQSLRDCWSEIEDFVQDQHICGHNVGVDKQLLLKEFPLITNKSYIDTFNIYRQLYGGQIPDYSLEALLHTFELHDKLEDLKVNDHWQAHRALYDAVGSALLLTRLYQDPQTRPLFDSPVQDELF